MSNIKKLFHIILLLNIFNFLNSQCSKGQVNYMNQCVNCYDSNCEECIFPTIGSCKSCFDNYEIYEGLCYEKCQKIKHCKICDEKENKCILCKKMCNVKSNGECSCIIKYVTITLCVLIPIIVILLLLKFLLTSASTKGLVDFPHIIVYPEVHEITRTNNSNKFLSKENSIKEFEENLFVFEDFNRKCDFCKTNICNISLNCGCVCCFDCQKKFLSNNTTCLNCKKEINNMKQITCSICFNNKKELSKFKCQCSLVSFKDCYIKWRLKHNFCPACRKNLNIIDEKIYKSN